MTLLLALLLSATPVARAPLMPLSEFCPASYTPLPGGGCLAVPARFAPGHLVLYFHGMLPPDMKSPRELTVLAREALPKGYAVLALRGEPGLCPWGGNDAWWCFPSDLSQVPRISEVRRRLDGVLDEARTLLGVHELGAPLVAGFSNGGYFTTLLLSDTTFTAKAWAVLHAGGVNGQKFPPQRRSPVLLLLASDDVYQAPGMRTLATTLKESGWPVTVGVRAGVHEVQEDDARHLVSYFETQLKGP